MPNHFVDEATPLPPPSPPRADPDSATGKLVEMRLSGTDGDIHDGAWLYPRLRFESACDSADELSRLYAPYFDGTSVLLFTNDVRDVGLRVLVELVLSTGQCVLRGIADSVAAHPGDAAFPAPGLRLRLVGIDELTSSFFAELTATARALPRPTKKLHALPRSGSRSEERNETVEMSKLQLTELMGLPPEDRIGSWNDLLVCKLSVSNAGECRGRPPLAPPHQTTRTVVTEIAEAETETETETEAETETEMVALPVQWWWRPRWLVVGFAAMLLGLVLLLR